MTSPLIQALSENLRRFADRTCLHVEGESITYGELDRRSLAIAEFLAGECVRPGGWVGLWFEPCLEYWVSLVGLWRLNATPVVFSPKLPAAQNDELARQIPLAAVLCRPHCLPQLPAVRVLPLPALLNDPRGDLPARVPAAGDLALLQFTSGSTGISKAVLISHRSLGGNALATRKALGLTADDRWFFNMPFPSMSAIAHVLTNLVAGSSIYAIDRFCFPEETIALLSRFGATGLGGSPIQARWLVDYLAEPGRVPTLRRVMTSGDKLPDYLYDELPLKLPAARLHNFYGLTELGGRFCALDPHEAGRRPGSVGRPIEGLRCVIRDADSGAPLLPRQTGEVYAEGNLLADGYYGLEEQTRHTFTGHGLRTGDLGWQDEDGFLYLVGRKDDVFKSSGEKVSTVLIEQTLLEMKAFADVAVVGVPDEFLGMVPRVYYVLEPGTTLDRQRVLAWLRERLPPSHLPQCFEALDQIPRTATGKVIRPALRGLAQATRAAG